jgi:putative MATE family efflux protein
LSEAPSEKSVLQSDILNMPVQRAIFHLAWPTIFSGILENLTTTVDMIMVGKLGAPAIAAVGFCGMINWTLASLMMGLSIAVTAIVARNYGGGQKEEAEVAVAQAIIVSLILAAGITVVILAGAPWILRFLGVQDDVYELAVPYLKIISVSGIFFAVLISLASALRGAGDTRTPLYIALITNFFHVGLNYVLIFGKLGFPAMGVTGSAIGSMISLFIATLILFFLCHTGWLKLKLSFTHFRWNSNQMRDLIRIAIPASIEQFVVQLGILIYARFIVDYGTVALSGYQVGSQVLSLSFIPNGAFSIAASTLVGQNLGAMRKTEAKRAAWICLVLGTLSMSTIAAITLFNAEFLASVFVKEPEVIRLGAAFIAIVAFSQPAMAIYFTLAGALRGAGDTRSPLFVTLISMYGLRIPGAFLASRFMNIGLELTFGLLILDYMARASGILFFFRKGKWMK